MRKILLSLVLVGCASGGNTETREEPTIENQGKPEEVIDPERHEAIERTFTRKVGELQRCWQDEYDKKHDRSMAGDVTVQIMIPKEGKPSTVKILKSTFAAGNGIEPCVLETIPQWAFPEGKHTVPVRRTIHLGAQF
jgi:hypothetical protein